MRDAIGTLGIIGMLVLAFIGGMSLVEKKWGYRPPVERIGLDSIVTANDSIKIKVNNLDSIKHAKIVEVYSLDSDSTVKLFYKLVKDR